MSSFKLFEIPEAIELASENMVDPETGEILDEAGVKELISKLNIEANKKTEYICKEIKNLKAEEDALKEQKKVFDARIKSAQRRQESLKNYLRFALNGEKWKADDASVSVSYRTTKDCFVLDDIDSIPEEYFKTPHTESNIDKTTIKTNILDGAKITGCHLEDKTSTIIK